MLMANSDLSSSTLSGSPLIHNLVETLGEYSSPIASIGAHVVQSLAISSQDRVCRDDQDSLSTDTSIPSQNSDGSSSSSLIDALFVPSVVSLEHGGDCYYTQLMTEPQILPLSKPGSNNSLQSGSSSQTTNDIDDELWLSCSPSRQDNHQKTPNVSSGYGTDDNCEMEPFVPTGVGAGLWNLGNTCFINSVLQCFTHTVPLIESLRSFKYQDPCNCNEQFCVVKTLRIHIEVALRPSRYPVSPYYFLNNLNYFSPDFQCYQQEDAHEFLQAFLDKLERCCLDRRSHCANISSQDVNIVEQVFGGRLVSRLRCCNCNSVSETFESSLGLSLEIEDVDSLLSALESFTRVEKLDEQLTCDDCEEKVLKEKQLLLDKLPLIATFHLKRFKNNGFYMEKIFKHIKIPLELELQPYMSGNNENDLPTKYHLYALVEHLGFSLAYGHYSSYVRSAPKIWHKFDDWEVTKIDEDNVPSEGSYILFYAREGTPWFSRAFEDNLDSSPKSVLEPTNGECSSDISYENVCKSNKPCDSSGVSNPHFKTEENCDESNKDVFLSAGESSGEDTPIAEILDPLGPDDDSDNQCTEKGPNSCLAVAKRATANTGDDSAEGTFQIQLEQLETGKNQEEEPCKQPLLTSDVEDYKETEIAHKGLMKKHLPYRARELDQAISKTASLPKKPKTA